MSLVYSNILATVAVICLPIAGKVWIASTSVKRCFFILNLWGVPFAIAQYAQEDGWGPVWFQYHFLDLCYVPWGTALVMCLLAITIRRGMTTEALFTISLVLTLGFGYVTEAWDTMWAWHDGQAFVQAIDTDDYLTITVGGIITVAFYLWSKRPTSKG